MVRRSIYIPPPAPPSGGNLLLDDYPGAVVALSLYRRRQAYSGFCMRIRRASDDAVQDVGFVADYFDVGGAETFCSGTDGFVEIWYDQSGNGNNLIQSSTSAQPQIIANGSTIQTSAGLNAVQTGSGLTLSSGAVPELNGGGTCAKWWAGEITNASSRNFATLNYAAGTFFVIRMAPNGWNVGTASPGRYANVQANNTPAHGILHGDIIGTNVTRAYYNDGAAVDSQPIIANLDTHISCQLGSGTQLEWHLESIYYPTEQESNHAGIRDALNSDYSIF